MPLTEGKKSVKQYIAASKLFIALWGVVQITTGMLAAFILMRSMPPQ